jgi:[NiFe] hydrogenase assembly HybE family chaperone
MNDAGLSSDPSARLTAAFRAAAARMAGLALINPALDVEAVGFAPWHGHWLGVLVTPWCMNLVLTPHLASAWSALAPGAKRRYRFPAGTYEFVGAVDDTVGEYQTCSLFSPMLEFDDHATARRVAELAREALLDPANAEAPGAAARAPDERALVALDTPVSRRDLLHGLLRVPR